LLLSCDVFSVIKTFSPLHISVALIYEFKPL